MSSPRSVSDALEILVEPFDNVGDWNAVLDAAGVRTAPPGRPFYRRPRFVVAVALLALAVALVATPAFGVRGLLGDLFDRTNVSFPQAHSASNLVKKRFLDLSLAAPRQWQPGTIASEARVAGTFTIGGHRRHLWVAPTRRGGYCFIFELSTGGCRATRADRAAGKAGALSPSFMTKSATSSGPAIVERATGDLDVPTATSLTIHYADGGKHAIPFVWVSKPIAAGFFSYDIPTSRWTPARRAISLTAQDASGRRLATYRFPALAPRPAPRLHVAAPPTLPAHPTPPPSAPVQRGSADGFSVEAGRNGSVQFTEVAPTAAAAELRGHNDDYVCFRLTQEFGIFTERTVAYMARFAANVGLNASRIGSLSGPFDGCEIEASAGHLWPDKHRSHSAVEVPFTAKGRAFFADRAAARDLGLFVRTRRVRDIRRNPPAIAFRELKSVYRAALAHSRIRIAMRSGELMMTEKSTTGRTFSVTIRHGKIVRQNLEPYAFAF